MRPLGRSSAPSPWLARSRPLLELRSCLKRRVVWRSLALARAPPLARCRESERSSDQSCCISERIARPKPRNSDRSGRRRNSPRPTARSPKLFSVQDASSRRAKLRPTWRRGKYFPSGKRLNSRSFNFKVQSKAHGPSSKRQAEGLRSFDAIELGASSLLELLVAESQRKVSQLCIGPARGDTGRA